jgi:crotonobetainyl-CoA:carnitine CoA-transferase CaiB-like acyl-CoA transferase
MALPLEGYRVLAMTIRQQGTNATALLADFGADTIKIEGPDAPDPGRGLTAGGAGTPMRAYEPRHGIPYAYVQRL